MMKTDFIKTNNPARVRSFFVLSTLLAGLQRGRSIQLVLILFAASALFGCSTTRPDYSGTPATDIVVTISCSEPNARFDGTVVTDGVSQHLSGNGTGTYKISGHKFICKFEKFDAPGSITISIFEAGHTIGNSSTTRPSGGVRAEIFRTPLQYHTIFTTF